jgi:magnesium-transporting ATPase (P-type)
MVTGDHARTAITVARQCEIMDDSTAALVVDADKGKDYTTPHKWGS